MTTLEPVSIPKRLYAFALDLAVVTLLKIFMLQACAGYLQTILPRVPDIENKMALFVFTLFPLVWVGYTAVSTFIFGSTLGSKAFGYHFVRIENNQKMELTFAQSMQRSLIMLTCIYTWGLIAGVMLLRKGSHSKVITDVVDNVFAIYDNHTEVLQVTYLPARTIDESIDKKDAA